MLIRFQMNIGMPVNTDFSLSTRLSIKESHLQIIN